MTTEIRFSNHSLQLITPRVWKGLEPDVVSFGHRLIAATASAKCGHHGT